MTKYTFTFEPGAEGKFRQILNRLDPEEYNVLEDVRVVDLKPNEDARYADRQMIIEMDPEAALTFRMGMKELKIRRDRTEEELAEEKRINDQHTIKITIQVPPEDLKPVP